ncbi:hypothetical protein XENOCAPTIV_002703 [Xenoophorus captivus]|uniref:Potassium channel tetramerisation-type BTB domain-containing protein n=1 Tax=Xenoophorus captivus TaxID=1517983 RepID=A0ABV0RP45_9TELE
MQQNGSSGSNGSDGCGARERQALSFSPLPAATTRVRRFIQERQRTLPKVTVVFSAAGDADKPSEAISSSDPTEEGDGVRKPPASPSPKHPTPSKPLRSSLSTQEQQESLWIFTRWLGFLRSPALIGWNLCHVDLSFISNFPKFPEVISLNVGGTYFTTRLSTLRRYEDTMLAAMFSGRHYIPRDAEGRFFIDRDGAYFGCAALCS